MNEPSPDNSPGAPRSDLPVSGDREFRMWAMGLHLSQLAGFVIPFAGLIAPIVIWQVKKAYMPAIDPHGKVVVNWLLSVLIYGAVALLLSFILIGIPLLFILTVLAIVFPIIGGIKANEGEVWPYPLSIPFLR